MARWVDAALAGLREPTPSGAPPSVQWALRLWRVSVVALPLMVLAASFGGIMLGTSAIAAAQAIMSDGRLILMSLGLILIAAVFLMILGGVLIVVGALGLLIAPLFFGVLSRALGKILRGDSRGVAASAGIAIPALTLGILLSGVLVLALAGDVVAQLLALLIVWGILAVPAAGPFLSLLPRTRRWLTLRNARRDAAARTPVVRPQEWLIEPSIEEFEL